MASKEEKAANKKAEQEAKAAAEASTEATETTQESAPEAQVEAEAEAEAPAAPEAPKADERTLGEKAAQVTESVKAKGKLKLGKADLNPQEDALLREVVQLQYHQEGRAVQQKDVTQDMVDELCQYGSFLGKLGWLRAKYHESMKK